MIRLVALRLIYQMFSTLLGWIVLRTRSDTTNEIEILVSATNSPCPQAQTARRRPRTERRPDHLPPPGPPHQSQ